MPMAVKLPSALSPGMLRRNRTDPSPKRKFEPPVCRLEKSSSPPSVSDVALLRWLWASTSVGAGANAADDPGQGFSGPRLHTPPGIAPTQTPLAFDHARSPMKIV